MALGGRPKEEGGHRDRKLSFDKFTNEALDKIKRGGGNISQYIEKALKPELENLDPGEVSREIWRYETYINQRISQALIEDKPKKAKALASILVALKDYRNLSGIPPLDPDLLSTTTHERRFYLNRLEEIRKENLEGDGKKAMLNIVSFTYMLPPSITEELTPSIDAAIESFRREYGKSTSLIRGKRKAPAPEVDFLISEICNLLYRKL